jgi:Holliday junction resolvase RusA-like endonuclease
MAVQKGKLSRITSAVKGKLALLSETEYELEIEKNEEEGTVGVLIRMTSVMVPYMRTRMSAGSENSKGHMYDPLQSYKNRIRKTLKELLEEKDPDYELCSGEITFDITTVSVPPKGLTKKQMVWAVIKKLLRPITKPDLDNVAKTAMDICSTLFWVDDNQVIELRARKFYGERPETIIKIEMNMKPLEIRGRANKEEEELWKSIRIAR